MKYNDKIRNVAILGNGSLGTQIAMLVKDHGYNVFLYDPVENMFHNTMAKFRENFENKRIDPAIPFNRWDDIENGCCQCGSIEKAVKDADLVIEAVPEFIDMKKNVFEIMGQSAPSHAILATNSSSIPVSRIEKSSGHPERCMNIHFYQILSGMNMVDVMGGSQTLPEIKEKSVSWVRSIHCVPLLVNKELLGFCFNRVWRAVKRETLYMWGSGFVDYRDIDRAWMIFTGMNMGPFGLMDLVGLDTIYNIEMVYHEDSKDPKDHPPKGLQTKIDRGELGVKTGKGFYEYPNPEYARVDFLNP